MTKQAWEDIIAYAYEELDWIATDLNGEIAVFSALMTAPIHRQIKQSYEAYMDLKQFISSLPMAQTPILVSKGSGNFTDWLNYSRKGLFAFDFQDVHRKVKLNQYDLIARPEKPMKLLDLNLPIELLNYIPRIDCYFKDGDIGFEKIPE